MGGLIDLNSADLATLVKQVGLPVHRAELLLARRPFWDFSEIGGLAGFGPKTLARLSQVATVVPPPAVDINRCSLDDLMALPGIGPELARRIVARRPFAALEDLTGVKGIGSGILPRLQRRATVQPPPLLNVNLASERELCRLPGVGKAIARHIVEKRPFADFDDMAHEAKLTKNQQERLAPLVIFEGDGDASAIEAESHAPPPADGDQEHAVTELAGGDSGPSTPTDFQRPQREESRFAGPDVLKDIEWVVLDDHEYEAPEPVSLVPDARSLTLSTAEFEASLRREIVRRMPLFVSGWVFAGVILLALLGLYALDLISFGPEAVSRPVVAAESVVGETVARAAPSQPPTALGPTPVETPAAGAAAALVEPSPSPTEEPAPPPATALPDYLNPLANLGSPVFSELFAPGDYWELESNELAHIEIELERLTITMRSSAAIAWARNGYSGADFYYQGTVVPENCQSGDYYGLVFRSLDDFNLYLFGVSCDGEYRVVRRTDGQFDSLVDFTPDAGILAGEQLNLLGVRATGSEMHFYVNDTHLTALNDLSLSEGRFGVFAKSLSNPSLAVHFDDLAAWSISP